MVSCDLDLPMESSAAVLFNDIPSAWNQNAHRTLNVSLNWMSFENHMFHIATEFSCVRGGDIMSLTWVQSSVQVATLREGEIAIVK